MRKFNLFSDTFYYIGRVIRAGKLAFAIKKGVRILEHHSTDTITILSGTLPCVTAVLTKFCTCSRAPEQ